jgi:hypothetical protein
MMGMQWCGSVGVGCVTIQVSHVVKGGDDFRCRVWFGETYGRGGLGAEGGVRGWKVECFTVRIILILRVVSMGIVVWSVDGLKVL